MKVLITHFYTRENRGDAAILESLIQELQRVLKKPQIAISTMEKPGQYSKFERTPTETSFIYWIRQKDGFIIQVLRTVYLYLATFGWAIYYRLLKKALNSLFPKSLNSLLEQYQKADLIILVGGGYLRADSSIDATLNLVQLYQPIVLAKLMGKKVVLHSMSIGPFSTSFQNFISAIVLRHVDFTLLRESISASILDKFKIKLSKYMLTSDAAFLFTNEIKSKEKSYKLPSGNKSKKRVGLTVRKWLAPAEQENYEKAMAEFADYLLVKQDAVVVFIPQGTNDRFDDDDRDIAKKVQSKMINSQHRNLIVILDKPDHHQVKQLYSKMDYLVGTRFHSVIFALISYVPCIAVEYEHKTRGIMADLSLEKWVLKMNSVNSNLLISKFKDLVKSRKSYVKHLREVMPEYQKNGRHGIERMLQEANITLFS